MNRYEIVPVTSYELRRIVVSEDGTILLRNGKPMGERVGVFEKEDQAAIFRDQLMQMDVA